MDFVKLLFYPNRSAHEQRDAGRLRRASVAARVRVRVRDPDP